MNCKCNFGTILRTVVRTIAILMLSAATSITVCFAMHPEYWGAHGWYVLRSLDAIFGEDKFSRDAIAGNLVLKAWAEAGYPTEFTVVDIPDIGRYVGRIIYEHLDHSGNTVRKDMYFNIRWDYEFVAENPAKVMGPTFPDKTEFDE